ncbi:Golgi apparatus membrane protein TVP23 [Lactarius indigo]|nr:Golgi apparatus membrane protein TVP23 [Lactarius indigo]
MSTTIEPDEPTRERPSGPVSVSSADLESGNHPTQGLTGILRQSAHPVALFVLYLLRIAAIATYILCGFFTDNYVVSTVIVVVLLAMDFWNCRNVAGRTLVGLRFWNQVDDDGESYWIFESRDPSRPANPVDSRLFWTALYVFPALWLGLFFVSLLKFNLSFVPIVVLALVFNVTNVIGFTYADRDAKKRWAQNIVSSSWSIGGLGGQVLTGVVKNSVGRVFGS